MAAVAGVYRRILPSPPAIEFASSEGKRLFAKALENGHMEGFFKLISYYQTQSEPAYCGLATLAMVLNSLAIDPARKWKGPWRWFDDSMLDCCEPLEKIKVNGISFGRVACLAQCNGAKVEAFRTNESKVDNFRRHVMSCTSSEDCHMVVTYHRGYLKQTGTGHFSPIGGYHAERDMVLILDVARFKYPPHWVPLTLLWEAMDTVDEATGHRRGFMLISRPNRAPSILYTLSCRHGSWNATAKYLAEDVPRLISSKEIKDVQEMLSLVFTSAPADLRDFINWVAEVRRQEDKSELITEEEKKRLAIKEEVLKQVHETNLYENLTRWLASKSCCKYANNSLTDIASTVCFQGAQLLCGQLGPDGVCCRTSEVKLVESDDNKPVTVISGKVGAGAAASEVDMLVPCCQMKPDSFCACDAKNSNGKHPSVDDVLTVLILAMPPSTWSGIKDERLRDEVLSLVSADTLRPLLQEEILHLRQQLYFITSECTSHA